MLDAPISKTTTGFKSFLLKIVDPLFRKQGAEHAVANRRVRDGESAFIWASTGAVS